jgi:hypothetical protein
MLMNEVSSERDVRDVIMNTGTDGTIGVAPEGSGVHLPVWQIQSSGCQ